jgi:hypothetical protein
LTRTENPRKGITHTWDDVNAELCDVIRTAMVALTTLTPDARKIFDEHLTHVTQRCTQLPASITSPDARAAISSAAGT